MFYGEQSVEQMLQAYTPGHLALPQGSTADYPSVGHRGIMIDLGRHFWPLADLESEIREMSWDKINYAHLHFTDDTAFRLQSANYPHLAPAGASYSPTDIANLVAYAAKYHVTIVPEIDLPGHSNAILSDSTDPVVPGSTNGAKLSSLAWPSSCTSTANPMWGLDVTNQNTLTFATNIINEFAGEFTNSPVFHTGGDEYPGLTAQQACPELTGLYGSSPENGYANFTNKLDGIVQAARPNEQMEIWDWWETVGGYTTTPNADIVIDDWNTHDGSNFGGYPGVVSSDQNWYITPGTFFYTNGWLTMPDDATLYASFTPTTATNVQGYEASLWGDGEHNATDAFFDSYLHRPRQGPGRPPLGRSPDVVHDARKQRRRDRRRARRHALLPGRREAAHRHPVWNHRVLEQQRQH